MRILAAEDDPVSRRILEVSLASWGHELVAVASGDQAWSLLEGEDPPRIALLDWMMPGIDGTELCRRIRETPRLSSMYVLLLTARARKEDLLAGLAAGADDYLIKPVHLPELRARLGVARRIVDLQDRLAFRVAELEDALAGVRTLRGLLPICSYCKKIRGDGDYWQKVEAYVSQHSEARFSHGICPECEEKYVAPELEALRHEP